MPSPSDDRESWRLLPYDLGPSDRHFALSDALARHSRVPTVWAHSTDQPTLILGAGRCDPALELAATRAHGLRVVQRQAGGTAVFAGPGVLGVDIAVPSSHRLASPDVVEAYRWIGGVWEQAMRGLGIDARAVSVQEARAGFKTADPVVESAMRMACFGTLSPYEVVVHGRKLVGLAQVRRRGVVLWQSGVHVHFDAHALAALIPGQDGDQLSRELRHRAIGLDELISPAPALETIVQALLSSLTEQVGIELRPDPWTEQELSHVKGTS
jgi:lipoate-protein ligase A